MSYHDRDIALKPGNLNSLVHARELFDFQDTASRVSQAYQESLRSILDDGVKVVLLSSLDDQMVRGFVDGKQTFYLIMACGVP